MSDTPTFTTIIPTFRRPTLLKRAVISALNQTYPYVRVLVLDNASGDATADVVRELIARDVRVSYICHAKNIGSNPNFNYGLRCVETDFFSLLCDDDMLTPWFYENAMECFARFPNAMMVVMPTMVITTEGLVCSEPILPRQTRFYEAGTAFEATCDNKIDLTWTGTVYRREVPQLVGSINEHAEFADRGFIIRCTARLPLVVFPSIGGILMEHKDSGSLNTTAQVGATRSRSMQLLITDIKHDPLISADIKKNVEKIMFIENSLLTSFMQFIHALRLNRISQAQNIVRGVAEIGHPLFSRIYSVILLLYRYSLIIRPLLKIFLSIRSAVIHQKYKKITRRYPDIIELVKNLNKKACITEYREPLF